MTGSRPKALVTAAVSGPGLDLLHQLADLVLDSWLDQPSLRIYNAEQLAERVVAVGPEGGWSTDELASGLPTVGFGLSVLRAETAAVTAGALMASLRTGTVAPVGSAPTS